MAITARTLRLAREVRELLARLVNALTRNLTAGWARAWDRLTARFSTAVKSLLAGNGGRWPSRRQLNQSVPLNEAIRAATTEHDRLVQLLRTASTDTAQAAVSATSTSQAGLINSQLPTGHARNIEQLTDDALSTIVRRADGRITSLSRPLTRDVIAGIRQELVRGIRSGDDPDELARLMVRRLENQFGTGLSRALLIAQTEIQDAQREAARLAQLANADVLRGWTWICRLAPNSCFPAGTMIRSTRGDVPIEAVKVGDRVLTHAGNWRRVAATMCNPYNGELFSIEAGPLRVSATADHPFLVERQGELQWMEARHIRRGDTVFSDLESIPDQINHRLGEVAIKRRSDQPDNSEAERLQDGGLLGISGRNLRVPVGLIDLKGDHPFVQEKVDGSLPARDGLFLDVSDAEGFEGEPNISLGNGFPGVPSVAAQRTEASLRCWANPHGLLAREAVDTAWRPPALLRAMPVGRIIGPEDSSAAGAWPVNGLRAKALVGTVNLVSLAQRNAELSLASRADVGHASTRADGGTEALWRTGITRALDPTCFADEGDPGPSRALPSAAVGLFPLMGGITSHPAELPSTFSNPRRRDLEIDAAPLASPLHRHIVSGIAIDRISQPVFNIGVEGDHSYLANGVAAHNCGACWVMHGTEHPLDEPGPADHPNGKCTRGPLTKTWKELGFDFPETPSLLPDAQTAFASLSRSQQLAVMGPTRLDLLDRGEISWSDLATRRENPGWRPSITTTPVRDLIPS